MTKNAVIQAAIFATLAAGSELILYSFLTSAARAQNLVPFVKTESSDARNYPDAFTLNVQNGPDLGYAHIFFEFLAKEGYVCYRIPTDPPKTYAKKSKLAEILACDHVNNELPSVELRAALIFGSTQYTVYQVKVGGGDANDRRGLDYFANLIARVRYRIMKSFN